MEQPPAKRVKVDIDLTASETSTTTPAPAPASHAGAGAAAAKKKPAIASIFHPPAPSKGRWLADLRRKSSKSGGAGHFVWDDPQPSTKIAAFDIDGTLIVPRDGRKFPKNETDWTWLKPQVVPKLRQLHQDGFAIVWISNQAGNSSQQLKFKNKMPLMCRVLDVPVRVLAAWGHDEYRKSSTGMWDAFVRDWNGGVQIDYQQSFYVGDAAGRAGDHNDTDRKLALNCGLKFLTPEEFFLNKPPMPFALKGWDPSTHDHDGPLFSPTSSPLLPRRNSEFEDEHPPEVVIFVGFPGSGKTSFYKTHFAPKGYVHVNQDTLRTRSACLDLVSSCLSSSPPKSCVVDNTSPSRSVRAEYVSLIRAQFPGTKIRCFYFTAPMQLAMHNAVYRALCEPVDGGNGKMREVLPMIAFMTFRSNLEIPTPSEGFDEIKKINFKFEGTSEQRKNWTRWLADIYPLKTLAPAKAKGKGASTSQRK
ncbi:hypothetical protein C6P46_005813 [Rhodotorula mucilaginosa]|uniref:Uncharacterized protein n=1 Tax=Rhodotorula mucilaginosa TaxID=5537 RepID=A0A9P7B3Z2_RHOMI|nr:hypothetical protein C6P46_005813 [Rhodotorula mucilaginosa]TKA58280.1 hypothetical protein B0A53_00017 [Rhodotorula sp. CCFEE 5036]